MNLHIGNRANAECEATSLADGVENPIRPIQKMSPPSRTSNSHRLVLSDVHAAAALGWLRRLPRPKIPLSSHEALILEYEQSQLLTVSGKRFDLSPHFLSIGERMRHYSDILKDLSDLVTIPRGTHLGEVHLDLLPKPVTERLGSVTFTLSCCDPARRYTSAMDPRLNCDQVRDFGTALSRLLGGRARYEMPEKS